MCEITLIYQHKKDISQCEIHYYEYHNLNALKREINNFNSYFLAILYSKIIYKSIFYIKLLYQIFHLT